MGEVEEALEVVREESAVGAGRNKRVKAVDTLTIEMITAVTKAHDAARGANENAIKAYNAVSWRTAGFGDTFGPAARLCWLSCCYAGTIPRARQAHELSTEERG